MSGEGESQAYTNLLPTLRVKKSMSRVYAYISSTHFLKYVKKILEVSMKIIQLIGHVYTFKIVYRSEII